MLIMRRFILDRNIDRFERALRTETDSEKRRVISELLAVARRDRAALDRDERRRFPQSARLRPEK
jgi:hypothetical protein